MNNVLTTILIVASFLPASAQSDTSSATPSWFMTLHGGLLIAKKMVDTAPSISMMQGIRYQRFALGVGVGYDRYGDWKTLPVFTGVSYDFIQKPRHAFSLQMNTGYSKAWRLRDDETRQESGGAGGYFYHPSIAYRAGSGKVSIHISAGYKIQNVQYDGLPSWWSGWYWPHQVTVSQTMERLTFLIGIGLR